MSMTANDAAVEIFLHKGRLMKNAGEYRSYLKELLEELDITDPVEASVLGAVDAMIYDMACALGFTRRNWSSYSKRKEVILKLWRKS